MAGTLHLIRTCNIDTVGRSILETNVIIVSWALEAQVLGCREVWSVARLICSVAYLNLWSGFQMFDVECYSGLGLVHAKLGKVNLGN